ncbi:MAG: YunC family protein [Desulfobacterales bacterium]|nr:YunC family protein [Desulfobacterales bacterium]
MDWKGLSREQIKLGLPLLIIKGAKGFLACGYINVETCNRTGEACAIVTGVKTHDAMLAAEIKAVSAEAAKLGVCIGMKGEEALEIFR